MADNDVFPLFNVMISPIRWPIWHISIHMNQQGNRGYQTSPAVVLPPGELY